MTLVLPLVLPLEQVTVASLNSLEEAGDLVGIQVASWEEGEGESEPGKLHTAKIDLELHIRYKVVE